MRKGQFHAAASGALRSPGGGAGRLWSVLRYGLLSVCVGGLAASGGCAVLEPNAHATPDRPGAADGGAIALAVAEDSSLRTVWIESTSGAAELVRTGQPDRTEATPNVAFCDALATVRFVAPSADGAGAAAAQLAVAIEPQETSSGDSLEEIPLPDAPAKKSSAAVELKPMVVLGTDIQPKEGDLPEDHAGDMFGSHGTLRYRRELAMSGDELPIFLASADFYHYPLYFEQFNLERYGYHHGPFQALVSGAVFYGTLPALPYLAAVDRPREWVGTAGPYGLGQFGPCRHVLPPWNFRAALFEAGVVTALVFVIP